jgi:hypothetical protein
MSTSWRLSGLQPHLAVLPTPEPSTLSRQGIVTGNDWGTEYRIYRGRSLTLWVAANPVFVQLASEMPPDPISWHSEPIYLPIGPFSHPGLFGGFRFKSAVAGQPATINFSAYATGA